MTRLAPALVLAALAGCTLGADYLRPTLATPPAWRDAAPEPDAASLANLAWWDLFRDAELRRLVDEALEANHDLRIAVARVDQARARVGLARADRLPRVDGRGSYARQRFSEEGTFPLEDPETDVFVLSGDAAFELDFWGRLRRASEAARAELLADEATRQTVVLTLVADVAVTYLELRALDLVLDVTRHTVEARRRSLAIVAERHDAGLASPLDLRQAEADLARTAAEIPDLERRIAQTENRLSVLVGRNPGAIARGLPLAGQVPPPAVPPGLPSDLLERRPDLREAEAALVAANARIAIAKAAFFPRIELTGAYGVESVALSDLFTGPARAWQFGPRVSVPIFAGGRNRANLEIAEAVEREALARYEQAVRQAFRDVEDALVAHRRARETLAAEREVVRASRAALAVAESRYASGLTTYVNVLDAQRGLFAAEIAESRALYAELAAVVQLYRALGGGWEPARGRLAVLPDEAGTAGDPDAGSPIARLRSE